MSNRTPFIAFDTFALRDLIGRLTDNELRLYVAMCTYADGKTSRLFPGITELATITGIDAPATVHDTLNTLNRKGLFDYIRQGAKDPDTGRAIPNVYQICGPFLPANSIKSDSALKIENTATTINNNNQKQQSKKNNQEPPPPTTKPLRGPQMKGDDRQAATTEDEADRTKDTTTTTDKEHHQNSKTAAQRKKDKGREQNPSPHSEAPSPRDLGAYHAPLPEPERERMAAKIEAECDCTTPVAREMAATWELGAIDAALNEMRALAQAGKIRQSKYGLTLWHLRNNAISPEDTAKARRAAAIKAITDGGLLSDKETGQTCHFVNRAGNQITMAYDDGHNYTVSIDAAIDLYTPAKAASGE
jgi:hypothetical protein